MTNAVAVLPGYLGGSLAYRREPEGQRSRAYALALTSAAGALLGGVLLLAGSEAQFEAIVPFLLLGSCALLAAQPALSRMTRPAGERSVCLHAAAVYGGYFGAGLGIMLLAVLAPSRACCHCSSGRSRWPTSRSRRPSSGPRPG